jgi:hypothetical protein
VFHRHIETLLNHWVFVIDVWSRSHINCRTRLIVIRILSFILETTFTCIKHHCILQIFISRLAVCTWSFICCWLRSCILSRSWNFKFQTLPIEYLIIIKPWGCCIKCYFLAWVCFIVISSCLPNPLRSFVQVWNNSTRCTNSSRSAAYIKSWWWTSRTDCFPGFLRIEDANIWILAINFDETISCWLEEYTLCVWSFLIICLWLSWVTNSTLFCVLYLSLDGFLYSIVIMARTWAFFRFECTCLLSLCIASECS